MANTIHVDVVSAEEQIFSGEAEFVVLPGILGELGIYPRHTPLLTQIKPGAVRIKVPGQDEDELVFVQGGFLEVQPHLVTVLADTAVRAKDLDEVKAAEAKRAALEAMQNKTSREEIATAEAELADRRRATRSDPQDAPPRLTGAAPTRKGGPGRPFSARSPCSSATAARCSSGLLAGAQRGAIPRSCLRLRKVRAPRERRHARIALECCDAARRSGERR